MEIEHTPQGLQLVVETIADALFAAEAIGYACNDDELAVRETDEAIALFDIGFSGRQTDLPRPLSVKASWEAAQGFRGMRRTKERSSAAQYRRFRATAYLKYLNLPLALDSRE